MAGKTMIPLLAFAAWSGTGKTTLLKNDPGIMLPEGSVRAD